MVVGDCSHLSKLSPDGTGFAIGGVNPSDIGVNCPVPGVVSTDGTCSRMAVTTASLG